MCQTADAKRQWKKRNRYKMPRENYRRIMKGYEPHEPTNTFSFYKRKPVLKENRMCLAEAKKPTRVHKIDTRR